MAVGDPHLLQPTRPLSSSFPLSSIRSSVHPSVRPTSGWEAMGKSATYLLVSATPDLTWASSLLLLPYNKPRPPLPHIHTHTPHTPISHREAEYLKHTCMTDIQTCCNPQNLNKPCREYKKQTCECMHVCACTHAHIISQTHMYIYIQANAYRLFIPAIKPKVGDIRRFCMTLFLSITVYSSLSNVWIINVFWLLTV